MLSINTDQSTSESLRDLSDFLIEIPRRNEAEDQDAAPCGFELLTLISHGGYGRTIVTGVSRFTALVSKLA